MFRVALCNVFGVFRVRFVVFHDVIDVFSAELVVFGYFLFHTIFSRKLMVFCVPFRRILGFLYVDLVVFPMLSVFFF